MQWCGPNFEKPVSTEKLCLVETGHQPKFRKVYIIATGAPLTFCLAKLFVKHSFMDSFMKLGPCMYMLSRDVQE